jgi:hypothetical protein
MSFTRVEEDGIEFYTMHKTGLGGMSIAGLARLCGVHHSAIRQLLQRTHGSKVASKWLRSLIGKDLYLAVNSVHGAKILSAEACVAIIGYFAFSARKKRKEAEYAFEKFAYMGIEAWIQGITGWHIQTPLPEPTHEQVDKYIHDRLPKDQLAVAIHPGEIIKMLQQCGFSADGYRLYFYLEMMDLQNQTPTMETICSELKTIQEYCEVLDVAVTFEQTS